MILCSFIHSFILSYKQTRRQYPLSRSFGAVRKEKNDPTLKVEQSKYLRNVLGENTSGGIALRSISERSIASKIQL